MRKDYSYPRKVCGNMKLVTKIQTLTGPPPIAGTIAEASMTVEPNITR
jgi:hypothetical protein